MGDDFVMDEVDPIGPYEQVENTLAAFIAQLNETITR